MPNRVSFLIIRKAFLLFVICILLTSCSTSKSLENRSIVSGPLFTEPHIAFLIFEVEQKDGEISTILIDNIVAKGQLKMAHLDSRVLVVGGWEAAVVSKDMDELIVHRLGDPFTYDAETTDENGRLQRTKISLEEAELNFRLPIDGKAHYIVLRSLGSNGLTVQYTIDLSQ